MEVPSIVSKYVYEKEGAGLKGGYPLTADVGGAAPTVVGGAAPTVVGGATRHLAIPVGIVVVREYSVPMAHYDAPVSDGCVDDDLFETLLKKVGHREPAASNMTKKNKDDLSQRIVSKKSTKKHHKSR